MVTAEWPKGKIASGWSGECPFCGQEGAIFMVYEDGGVTIVCPRCQAGGYLGLDRKWAD